MFVVKRDDLRFLKRPLWTSAFGENKTLRGFVFVGTVNGVIQFFFNGLLYGEFLAVSFMLGLILGLTYMFFELPNSFLKRRLGIKPGERPERLSSLLIILDKSDSALGVCLVFSLYKGLSAITFVTFFLLAFSIHLLLSKLLHVLRVKESL